MTPTETTPFNVQQSLSQSHSRYTKLKARVASLAVSVQGALPLQGVTATQQEAFLLTFADLKKLELLLPFTEEVISTLPLAPINKKAKGHANGFFGALLELAAEAAEAAREQMGVDGQVFFETMIKDLDRQVELLEGLVDRAEDTFKKTGL